MAKKKVLTFADLLPGLLALMGRWPSVVFNIFAYLKLRPHTPLTIGSVLERNAVKYGDRAAILTENVRITHRSFNRRVNRYARFLASQGLGRGDVVAVWMGNRPELLVVVGALAKIGAVAALIDPRQRSVLLRHRLEMTAPRAFIIEDELLADFEALRPELDLDPHIPLCRLAGEDRHPPVEGYIDLAEGSQAFPPDNPPADSRITLESPFAYVFTSGTTGLPKASVQIHRRWIGAMYWFGGVVLNLKPGDVHYCTLPFCHTNALIISWGSCAGKGATLAMRRKFSAGEFWRDCRKFRATSFIYVGEICRYLLERPPHVDDRRHRVCRMVGNGLRPDIRRAFISRFGVSTICEFYGTAEAPLIFTNLLNIDDTVGCCLTPYAIVEYDQNTAEPLRDPQGGLRRVKPGAAGLLISEVSHDVLFRGYTSRKETDQKLIRNVFKEGDCWFNSGDILRDLGFRHARFVERLGDTFRWKGENVSCAEVEQVVDRLHAVAHAVVFGVAVPGAEGRAGMLAVVPREGVEGFDLMAMTEWLQSQLPPYAVPVFVRLMERVELTHTHKIAKHKLRRDGYNPERTTDDLFVRLPSRRGFEVLDRVLYADIRAGRYVF